MIEKKNVIDFFDRCAPSWDAEMIRDDEIIRLILDNARITAGKRVLDVACGTGVLIGDYLERGVESVTGIDISPEMTERAKAKFPDPRAEFFCCDAEEFTSDGKYDAIMIYNAFPHFPDPEKLFARLVPLLAEGGTLSVAHGMSREKIDAHHHGAAKEVSVGLMEAEKLSALMGKYLTVIEMISDERMYQVVGECRMRSQNA